MMMRLAMVVTMAMAMATVLANGQSTACTETFIANCNDMNTTAGVTKCCATISDFYHNDLGCLCLILELANLNPTEKSLLLTGCGVENGGTSPCSGSPVPFSPTPPSSIVPTPPSNFGLLGPPTTPPLFNTPLAVNNPSLAGRSGAARSSSTGMAGLVSLCSLYFGMMLVNVAM